MRIQGDTESSVGTLKRWATALLALSATGGAAAARDFQSTWETRSPAQKLSLRQSAGADHAPRSLPPAPAPGPHAHHHHHSRGLSALNVAPVVAPGVPVAAPSNVAQDAPAHWWAPQSAPQGESAPAGRG